LTNFPNGKQTQESLESGFPESEFRETNMSLMRIFVSPVFWRSRIIDLHVLIYGANDLSA
jgi:hypothetical protein